MNEIIDYDTLDKAIGAATRLMAALGFHYWNFDVMALDNETEPGLCIGVVMATTQDTYLISRRAKRFGVTITELLESVADIKRDLDASAIEHSVTIASPVYHDEKLPWSVVPKRKPLVSHNVLGADLDSHIGKMVTKYGTFAAVAEESIKDVNCGD